METQAHPPFDLERVQKTTGLILSKLFTLAERHMREFYDNLPLYLLQLSHLQTMTKSLIVELAKHQELFKNTVETYGENLLNGYNLLLSDLIKNDGHFVVPMTDINAFKVGEDIAVTPGNVVYQNELIQLIQYTPTTPTVYKRPILFVPPWINKFYILDLRPEKSLVKWLVDKGHPVFLISWLNPGADQRDMSFGDYMMKGPLAALDHLERQHGCPSVNMVGYCIGGTLLSCALSYMAQNNDHRAATTTYLATLLDFSDPGPLGDYVDPLQLHAVDQIIQKKGFLDGRHLAVVFNSLRPNELLWPPIVRYYLLHRKLPSFDLLYWNSDPTNLPAKMASFYLRKMYLENSLRKEGGLVLNNCKIDLRKITIPAFFISAEKDHIAPWTSTYEGVHLHRGPTTFVLSGSGHVASVTNHPAHKKYGYKTNDDIPLSSQRWLETCTQHEGSWWTHWHEWLSKDQHDQIPSQTIIKPDLHLEPAPGTYVLRRL